MTISFVDISKNEGSARPIGSAASKALIIGPSSAGTKETTIYTFGTTAGVNSDIGYGPVAELAQLFLAVAPPGYSSVDVLVSSGSGEQINVVSAANPTIVPSGTPYCSYDLRIQVTTAGDLGVGKFKYGLDGGNTYSDNIQIPGAGTYTIPNTGITLTFAAGTHAVGNQAHYDIQGPEITTTTLANCITTLSNSNTNYTLVALANEAKSPVSGAALFNAMDGHLTSLDNTYNKFTQAVVPIGGETKLFNRSSALTAGTFKPVSVLANITASAASTGNFITAVPEKANTYLAVPQPGYSRPRKPFGYMVAAEFHALGSDISANPAATVIRRVETPSYDDFLDGTVYSTEKLVAPRTWQGEPGIFIDQSHLKTAPNSTFDIWPKARVVSRAAEVVYAAVRPFVHKRVRVLTDGTGRIDPRDKVAIETAVNKQLRAALLTPTNGEGGAGHCTDLSFTVNGENNILSTGQMECTTLIVPFAYPRSITVAIALTDTIAVNPA
jgi:hypothetical protein